MSLYLSLSALHVSDILVHQQERRFGAVYRIWYKPVYADTSCCCVAIATQQPNVSEYTGIRGVAIK